jgi:predicted Holliday junction resolvase-like endonuclease
MTWESFIESQTPHDAFVIGETFGIIVILVLVLLAVWYVRWLNTTVAENKAERKQELREAVREAVKEGLASKEYKGWAEDIPKTDGKGGP